MSRNCLLIIFLCVIIFVGFFQTQYPNLYESFSNNDYATRTNLGNYNANVKYLLLKYNKIDDSQNKIKSIKMYLKRNGNIQQLDMLNQSQVSMVKQDLSSTNRYNKTIQNKGSNNQKSNLNNILADDDNYFQNKKDDSKIILIKFPSLSFKAYEINKIILETTDDGGNEFENTIKSFSIYDENKSLINENTININQKDQFDEFYSRFVFYNSSQYENILPKEYMFNGNYTKSNTYFASFKYNKTQEDKVDNYDETRQSYSSLDDEDSSKPSSLNSYYHKMNSINATDNSQFSKSSQLNDYNYSDSETNGLNNDMKYNRNAFRDSLSTIGNYLDNVMNSKLDANRSNKVVDPTSLSSSKSSNVSYKNGEYSGNNYYGNVIQTNSDLLGSSITSSNSNSNETSSKTSTNSQIYNKYTSVSNNSSDTSSTSQNTSSSVSIGNYGESSISSNDSTSTSTTSSYDSSTGNKKSSSSSSESELDKQYNNSASTSTDNSKYSYNNALNYNKSILNVVPNNQSYVISGSTGTNVVSSS